MKTDKETLDQEFTKAKNKVWHIMEVYRQTGNMLFNSFEAAQRGCGVDHLSADSRMLSGKIN